MLAGLLVCIRRHGAILRPLADVIVLMPPLAISLDELRRLLDALESALQDIFSTDGSPK